MYIEFVIIKIVKKAYVSCSLSQYCNSKKGGSYIVSYTVHCSDLGGPWDESFLSEFVAQI